MQALKQIALSLGTLAIAAALFFIIEGHAVGFALFLGAVALVVPFLWLLVSALRPAMPDRTCPACGRESLRLLKPGIREGVRCPTCGFSDPERYVPYLIDVDDALDAEGK